MIISLIVAVEQSGGIGKQGNIPWRLRDDLKLFKQTTMGHHLIVGRVTYESIGKALPGRHMLVITRQPDYQAPGCQVVHSLDAGVCSSPPGRRKRSLHRRRRADLSASLAAGATHLSDAYSRGGRVRHLLSAN